VVQLDDVLVKLWLQISHDEQLRRFERRQADPLKRWKLGPEDWRNRTKRGEYEAALRDMLTFTDHQLGPWDVIAAEDKRYARVSVLETVIARIETGMRREGIEPPPDPGWASADQD
jgi:polyphosphate kinase 2 (PPK2 family)